MAHLPGRSFIGEGAKHAYAITDNGDIQSFKMVETTLSTAEAEHWTKLLCHPDHKLVAGDSLKLPKFFPTDMTVADQAFFALGEYSRAPVNVRKHVVGKVLGICKTARNSRSRWNRLRAPGLRALQRLIGRRLNKVSQFLDWWDVVKSRRNPFA